MTDATDDLDYRESGQQDHFKRVDKELWEKQVWSRIPSWGEHNLHQRIKARQKASTEPNTLDELKKNIHTILDSTQPEHDVMMTSAEHHLLEQHKSKVNYLTEELLALFTEHSKAYGGCTNCYGKGYATVNGRWSGYGTDGDIGGFEGHVSGGNPNAMKFCTCDRGKQLELRIEEVDRLARLDTLNKFVEIEYRKIETQLSKRNK